MKSKNLYYLESVAISNSMQFLKYSDNIRYYKTILSISHRPQYLTKNNVKTTCLNFQFDTSIFTKYDLNQVKKVCFH